MKQGRRAGNVFQAGASLQAASNERNETIPGNSNSTTNVRIFLSLRLIKVVIIYWKKQKKKKCEPE